jgi:hypothetical protein
MITAECLRELLHYAPVTGIWTRRVRTTNSVKVGDVVGCIHRFGDRIINISGHRFRASRLAWFYMKSEWPKGDVDHINGDRADDRWQNLREASRAQNSMNVRMRVDNISGFKGVRWLRGRCKWPARIKLDGRERNVGYFDTAERAFIEYIFAAWRNFGDFAQIDADYIRVVRERKERKELETRILRNLARPDPNYMAT